MPLSVSVRDGHVSVSSGFARLADPAAQRAFGRLCWLPMVPSSQSDVEVYKCAAATDGPPGGCRCSTRASLLLPATFSCACITLPRTANDAHLRASESTGAPRRKRAPVIARGLLAPNVTARRRKCRVSSFGVLKQVVGERGHPGGRRVRESRGAWALARVISPVVPKWKRGGTSFRCIPDPETHLLSPPPTRPTIGMLNLVLKSRGLCLGRREEATARNRA